MKRMHITFLSIQAVLFLLILPASGISQSKDEKKILAVLRLEEKYWSNGDIDGYVSLYARLILRG